jgi:uncharacterized alpha/beta hydrolase family protein
MKKIFLTLLILAAAYLIAGLAMIAYRNYQADHNQTVKSVTTLKAR